VSLRERNNKSFSNQTLFIVGQPWWT